MPGDRAPRSGAERHRAAGGVQARFFSAEKSQCLLMEGGTIHRRSNNINIYI